jgi:hypothetical protein
MDDQLKRTYGLALEGIPAALVEVGSTLGFLTSPVDSTSAIWPLLRRLLVLRPSRTNRECQDGNLTSCMESLGLTDRDAPIDRWYDRSDLKWLGRDTYATSFASGSMEARRLCHDGDDDACARYVLMLPRGEVPFPTYWPARQSIIQLAVDLGGRDGLDRLLSTPGPIPARLSLVAGVPFDTLVAHWRSRVVHAPDQGTPPFATPLVTLALAGMIIGLQGRRRV